jgi:hypothetical protein
MPKKKTTTRRPARQRTCLAPDCDRPAYARGLCQTHHRQLRSVGELGPIRLYRQRTPGTGKLSGLRLSPRCIELIEQKAQREHLSVGAVIAGILEEWVGGAAREKRRPAPE